jgi:hypothetical protein
MAVDRRNTMILAHIYKGYTHGFILKKFNCHILTIINICRAVLSSYTFKSEGVVRVSEFFDTIKEKYPEEEHPELWI